MPATAPETSTPTTRVPTRALAVAATVGVLGFLACVTLAAAWYPGGTWMNRRAVGHSLWGNYLCDLMQLRARNGEPMPVASLVARAGTLLMCVALACFFEQVARLARARATTQVTLARVTRGFGVVGSALACAIPFLPSDHARVGHLVAVVASFLPCLVACIAAAALCLRAPATSRAVKLAALVTVIVGGLDGGLYILAYVSFWLGYVPPRETQLLVNELLPALQRVAMIALAAWILAVSAERRHH